MCELRANTPLCKRNIPLSSSTIFVASPVIKFSSQLIAVPTTRTPRSDVRPSMALLSISAGMVGPSMSFHFVGLKPSGVVIAVMFR